MKIIEYKLLPNITEELLQQRFSCFNESLGYYMSSDSAHEVYDDDSFHLQFNIEKELAGYTRLTPYPKNYMNLTSLSEITIQYDEYTLEMGRTLVAPKYRSLKLLNLILIIGLEICEKIGYRNVVGNVSYEDHLRMPASIGFEFLNIVADFKMPGDERGYHTFYLLRCELVKTRHLRHSKLEEIMQWFAEKGYMFDAV